MLRPVSRESCSRMCLVGFGVAANAAFSVSSCLALMVVRGPRRFPTALCSSVSLLPGSLSDRWPVSESFPSSCGSWESGDKLGSLHVVTAHEGEVAHFRCSVKKIFCLRKLCSEKRRILWFKSYCGVFSVVSIQWKKQNKHMDQTDGKNRLSSCYINEIKWH